MIKDIDIDAIAATNRKADVAKVKEVLAVRRKLKDSGVLTEKKTTAVAPPRKRLIARKLHR